MNGHKDLGLRNDFWLHETSCRTPIKRSPVKALHIPESGILNGFTGNSGHCSGYHSAD